MVGVLAGIGVIVGFAAFLAFSGILNNETKLTAVKQVNCDYPKDILTWDEVYGADSYNLIIDDKEGSTKKPTYTVDLDKEATEFTVKIQACNSRGDYACSDWAEFVIAVDQNDIINKVDRLIQDIPGTNMDMVKTLAVHAVDNKLYMTAVFEDLGKNYVVTYESTFSNDVTSLREAIDLKEAGHASSTYARSSHLAKDYDTASSFLAREEKTEKMQELADAGYQVSFVTSQAYEVTSDTLGIKGIIKTSNSDEIEYYSYDVSMYVGDSNNERYKYTTAVERAPLKGMIEDTFVELTGDFAEYAKAVEARNAASETTSSSEV